MRKFNFLVGFTDTHLGWVLFRHQLPTLSMYNYKFWLSQLQQFGNFGVEILGLGYRAQINVLLNLSLADYFDQPPTFAL